jgi:Ser/Thr protein kinase RdoA (MazF antagonist)
MRIPQHGDTAALSTDVPNFDPDRVAALVSQVYGIDARIEPLAGERDQNCCVRTADGIRRVFKISNPSEPAALVDFQIAALDHIAARAPDLAVQRVVKTLDGEQSASVELDDGRFTKIRMLTYLDGIQIKHTPRTAAQRRAMGRGLARLNLAMQDFSHPAASHDLLWNASAAHRLTEQLAALSGDARYPLACAFMENFVENVQPYLPAVRAQVIHNDYHLYNVLVDPEKQSVITGIIDFGDMLHAPLVGEVATAAAFHMADSDDPFEGPAQFIGAYHALLPLDDRELDIVADLMATRHLITALISEWRAARYPENRAYIMRHNPAAWEALAYMHRLPREEIRDRLLINVKK